jgi:hypothetical protein
LAHRQTKILTILVSALALTGLVWALGSAPEVVDAQWDPSAAVPVWDINQDEVVSVLTHSEDTAIQLTLREEQWWITQPERSRASPAVVGTLLDDLGNLSLGIEVPNASLVDYGLDEEKRKRITIQLANKESLELWVGDAAPIGWRTYVQRPGGPVVVVPGRLGQTVFKSVKELRDVAFVRFELSNSSAVQITSQAGTLDVYSDDGRWWVRGYGRAYPNRVDELFVGLANLRLDGWMDGVADEGIAEPVFDVKIQLTDGQEVGFQVGTHMPMGRLVRTNTGAAGYVQEATLALLNQGPNHVLDPKAFHI